jgi:hypothetical protein
VTASNTPNAMAGATPTFRKVDAAALPYGTSIARHGYVWAAFDGDKLVCAAATKGECRRLYKRLAMGPAPPSPSDPLAPAPVRWKRWDGSYR